MSNHSNQARKSAPMANRKAIRGNNPTYKTAVQKAAGGAMNGTAAAKSVGLQGSGHYTPNK